MWGYVGPGTKKNDRQGTVTLLHLCENKNLITPALPSSTTTATTIVSGHAAFFCVTLHDEAHKDHHDAPTTPSCHGPYSSIIVTVGKGTPTFHATPPHPRPPPAIAHVSDVGDVSFPSYFTAFVIWEQNIIIGVGITNILTQT